MCRGRLYLTVGVPSQGPPVQAGAVVVRPTGDVRGNGAFAAALIPKGTYLGDYTGELLDRAAFFRRYPDGVVRQQWGVVRQMHMGRACSGSGPGTWGGIALAQVQAPGKGARSGSGAGT